MQQRTLSGAAIGTGVGAVIGAVAGTAGGYLYDKDQKSKDAAYQKGYAAGQQTSKRVFR